MELNSAPEKAKYAAWRAKAGTNAASAMRSYLQESERQVRVYGMAAPASPAAPQLENHPSAGSSTNRSGAHGGNATAGASSGPTTTHSRGLAAIPLLCAAASEQRVAYLRRLQTTPTAWWRRQEPLTATPGTVPALPETLLLWVAATLERLALACNGRGGGSGDDSNGNKSGSEPLQALGAVVQSGLWPLHNALLAVWMALILMGTLGNAVTDLAQTVLLGSRRTGRTLSSIWADDVVFGSQSVHTLTEAHQPLAARVVGLVLQPYPLAVSLAEMVPGNNGNYLWMSCVFGLTVAFTGWYWLVALPWFLVVPVLGSALLLGNCFALIELAAHI